MWFNVFSRFGGCINLVFVSAGFGKGGHGHKHHHRF